MDPSEEGCLELALEGERLCQKGDHPAGVRSFRAAIERGTTDLRTLSAIYSQLGNAHFHLREYEKALDCHRQDLELARSLGDRLGEGKANGNVGNTLKVIGKFDEAIVHCTEHLKVSRDLGNRMGEARALYNLANIHHTQGKHLGRSRHRGPGDLSPEVEKSLCRAVELYEENVRLVRELGDRASEGRAYGNLGNTHHLLGNFTKAVEYHAQRLIIAREHNDTAAQCRALSNLANANVFLGEFETGLEYYEQTRAVARELNDTATEAHACFNLANTRTFLQRHEEAVELYLEYLSLVQHVHDGGVGEGRAYWSLGHVYTVLGKYAEALEYTEHHLRVSRALGDRTGELAAQMNIEDLKIVLGIPRNDSGGGEKKTESIPTSHQNNNNNNNNKNNNNNRIATTTTTDLPAKKKENLNEDFFDFLLKSQSSRMDDQRYEFPALKTQPRGVNTSSATTTVGVAGGSKENVSNEHRGSREGRDGLMDMIARLQGDRMEEQRCKSPAFLRKK